MDREGDRYVITNRSADGRVERFENMAFDGSPGPSFGRTREHFPYLDDWRLSDAGDGKLYLRNTDKDGTEAVFRNLVFHEGQGLALEMRLFTKDGIDDNLRAASFHQIEFEMQDYAEYGVIFGQPWSRPIAARRH